MLGCHKRESVRSGEKVIPMDVFQMSTLVENLRMNFRSISMSQISDPSLDSLRPGEDWTAFMDMNFEGEAGMKCIRKSKFTRKIDICSTFVAHF